MKAFISLLIILSFSLSIFAQESTETKAVQSEDTLRIQEIVQVVDSSGQVTVTEEILPAESNGSELTEKGSFTLDANDAVIKESTESEVVVETVTVSPDKTTYHYRNYNRNDGIQTLGGNNSHNGGFGAFVIKGTEFNDKDMILLGLRGGWIINRALAIGFEGYGIIPTAEYDNVDPASLLSMRAVGGYGGMFLEPIVFSNKLVHITFPISGGAGYLGYMLDWEQNYNYYDATIIDEDVFWYVEPGVALELNVARNFRIDLGASYRFTEDLELVNTSPEAFEAWNYFITFKFGSF